MRRSVILSVALGAITLAVYWPVGTLDFVRLDDDTYVTANLMVKDGITVPGIRWALTSFHAANWHPFTWFSHMLDVEFFGLEAARHHQVNLLLHTVNTILLFLVLRCYTGTLWRSAAVAALFAVHPLHVESVAWVAERKDLLAAGFWLLTMAAYRSYVRKPRLAIYLLTALLFALGLAAKPMLVSLPLVLLLLDAWPLNRLRPEVGGGAPYRALVMEKVPLLLLSASSAAVTFAAQRTGGAVNRLEDLSPVSRLANAFVSYVKYLLLMVWPRSLAVFYPHQGTGLPWREILPAAVTVLGITGLVLHCRGRIPFLKTGWFWYLLTLLPVIGLVQVGGQAMADRYTYIPSIGIFIMVLWGGHEIAAGNRRRVLLLSAALAVSLLALSVAARVQLGHWRTSTTLYLRALDVTEDNWVIEYNYGSLLSGEGKTSEAISHLREALRIVPEDGMAHSNLGVALLGERKIAEATRHFRAAARYSPGMAEAHNNLGAALLRQGEAGEAIPHLSEALRLQPDYVEARFNLGSALEMEGRFREAVLQFREVLRLDPGDSAARYRLQTGLRRLGGAPAAGK